MNELRANLKALVDGNGCYTGNNGLELLMLDLDTIEAKLTEYEEAVEELEYRIDDAILTDEATIKQVVKDELLGIDDFGQEYVADEYTYAFSVKEVHILANDIAVERENKRYTV